MNYSISEKQNTAIKNMELFCNINNHRNHFKSKKEFDDYFVLLQKKGKKKSNLLKAVSSGKITFTEINKKIKNKQIEYYSTFDTLKRYAIKYINRYVPTKKQLENQLYKKNKESNIVQEVIEKVSFMINEELIITAFINNLKFRGKNINYIKIKLYNKGFNKLLIKEKVDIITSEGTLLIDYNLENKINNLKNRGKSKYEISKKLIERTVDEDLVNDLINKTFGEDGEKDILVKKIYFLKNKNISKQKIIQRLMLKGFGYNDIIKLL